MWEVGESGNGGSVYNVTLDLMHLQTIGHGIITQQTVMVTLVLSTYFMHAMFTHIGSTSFAIYT